MNSLGYYLLFGFTWLVSLLPFWFLYRIADLLYWINFYVIRYRKKVVYKNLKIAFPEKSQSEIDVLAKKFYRHFSDFIVEILKSISLPKKKLQKRFRIKDLEIFREIFAEKKDFVLVSAHYNNWEWMTIFPFYIPHMFIAIYRPLQNKIFDRLQIYLRTHHAGSVLVTMDNVFRFTLKCRAEHTPFSIWLLADQRPPGSSKFWTNFMNHDVAFFEGVEKLARKLDLAVVFMDIDKIRRGNYEVHFTRVVDNPANLPENGIMLKCISMMEKQIKARPEYWLWSHNRFKHKKPENIKLITA